MTGRIVVCPAASLADVATAETPSHVVTLRSPDRPAPDLPPAPEEWLDLVFNDIAEPRPGLVPPNEAAVASLLAFGRSWSGSAPVLVSCEFGVSRSTASAFALACQAWPDWPEAEIARALRASAPCATPNILLVSLADRILGRRDRMTRAVGAIGRGAEYVRYRAFTLARAG